MLEYATPEMKDSDLGEHLYYAQLRDKIDKNYKERCKNCHSVEVGRVMEIPVYSYTRTLKYSEHVGREGVLYEVMYSYKGNPKTICITRSRFVKAYNKWMPKCWITDWENGKCSL